MTEKNKTKKKKRLKDRKKKENRFQQINKSTANRVRLDYYCIIDGYRI